MWFFGKKKRKKADSRFGEYFVNRLVHSGEKSLVFEAARMRAERPVAVKLYKPEYDRTAARIEKKYDIPSEAEVGLTLNPAEAEGSEDVPIVATIDHGREGGKRRGGRYIVQEFVRGVSLKHMISCDTDAVHERIGALAFQLCRALHVVHREGMVYRDFCSDNVLVRAGAGIKLIDLGFVAPAGIAFEERSGTPTYMSPEQIRGKPLGVESDIYSLGVVFYELLTGRLPFDAEGERGGGERRAEIMRMHLEERPPEIPDRFRKQARALAEAVPRCLAKNPAHRFGNLKEVMSALV